MPSPTQRTLKALRDLGMECEVVEKFNPYAGPMKADGTGRVGQRKDLFGFIDIIALDPDRGVIGVQSTGQGFSQHHKKITEECREKAIKWLSTPGTYLELWGWRKVVKERGSKVKVWRPRVKVYTLGDFYK